MDKLTAKEKVGIWCILFLARWMIPHEKMTKDMEEMIKHIQHQVNCHL